MLDRTRIPSWCLYPPSTRALSLLVWTLALSVLAVTSTRADTIDFDSQGITGPGIFYDASHGPVHIDIPTTAGVVQFDGGVVLTNTVNMPADQTSIYGTEDTFNSSFAATYTNPITITLPHPVSDLSLNVFNGLSESANYTVSDSLGQSKTFTLVPNFSGGTSSVSFGSIGSTVHITSSSNPFDFFIDNINYTQIPSIPVSPPTSANDFLFPVTSSREVHLVTISGGLSTDPSVIPTACGTAAAYFDPCHDSSHAYYALDISSSEGAVVAARSGTVVSVGIVHGSTQISGKCNDDSNCIVVDHHDGYYTEYREFELGADPITGQPFKIGDVITAGEALGTLPGEGGLALHFQVSTKDPSTGALDSKESNTALANVSVGGRLFKDYKLDMSDGHPVSTPIYGQTNPRLPTHDPNDPAFLYNIVIGDVGLGKDLPIYVDPPLAMGYDFQILSGPLFTSVILPNVGDGQFGLYLFDPAEDKCVFDRELRSGVQFQFNGDGVDRFCVEGIEASAALLTEDPTAFVVGLTFSDTGPVRFTQTALAASVPEPSTLSLLCVPIVGIVGCGARKNRRGHRHSGLIT